MDVLNEISPQTVGSSNVPSRIVMLCTGLGDQMLWLSQMPAFRRKNGPVTAVLTKGNGIREIAELYEGRAFDKLVDLGTPRPPALAEVMSSHFHPPPVLWATHIWFDERERYQLIAGGAGIADLIRIVYDLPPASAPAAPEISMAARMAAAERMSRLALPIGRTVLLAPWANSWQCALSDGWWAAAAAQLAHRGYKVVVNVSNLRGSDFVGLPGTTPIELPLAEVIPFAELAGGFLSMRSGLCDLLAFAECRKMVVYPHSTAVSSYLTGLPYQEACRFWSVSRAFQRRDIVELGVDCAAPFDPAIIDAWLDRGSAQ